MNEPPYTARLKQLLPYDVDLGIRHTHVALRDLRARLESGDWRGPGFGIVGITQVAQWLWEAGIGDEGSPTPYPEFAAFSPKPEE
jgi:hypothetical protein